MYTEVLVDLGSRCPIGTIFGNNNVFFVGQLHYHYPHHFGIFNLFSNRNIFGIYGISGQNYVVIC